MFTATRSTLQDYFSRLRAQTYELLKEECDGATVADGFNGNNTDLNEVTNWLKSQGYIND